MVGTLRVPLLGRRTQNALAALGSLCMSGVTLGDALAALENAPAVPGRMQRIDVAGAPLVIVDYAHSPDALEQTLRALREHASGEMSWCVFGCGGDRDLAPTVHGTYRLGACRRSAADQRQPATIHRRSSTTSLPESRLRARAVNAIALRRSATQSIRLHRVIVC